MFRRGPLPQHWHSIDTLNSGLVAPQASPTTGNSVANYAVYTPLMVRDTVVVKKLWVPCGATGSGNVDIGLYDASATRLVSSGATAHPVATTELVVDVTDTLISPGIYWVGIASSATQSFYQIIVTGVMEAACSHYYEASAYPLPASATWTSGFGAVFIGGILTNTVVS